MRTQRDDPSAVLVTCEHEGCGAQLRLGDTFSFVITFATTGPAVTAQGHRLAAFGCAAEQHFACSREHAAILAQRCVTEHLLPAHEAYAAVAREQVAREAAAGAAAATTVKTGRRRTGTRQRMRAPAPPLAENASTQEATSTVNDHAAIV